MCAQMIQTNDTAGGPLPGGCRVEAAGPKHPPAHHLEFGGSCFEEGFLLANADSASGAYISKGGGVYFGVLGGGSADKNPRGPKAH